jgi:hypothetical protein
MIARRNLLLLALVAVMAAAAPPSRAQEAEKTVRLTIDYGDSVEKSFTALVWQEKLTVLGALEAAARHPRGITFKHRGSGASAFVTAIDDIANEGRGRNWTYQVNGKRADKSCGVWELKAGDAVVWRYGQ